MITKGFVPATKDAIKGEKDEESGKHTNGKSYTLRRHGNLTTFDGLVEFRKMVAERDIQEGETMEQAVCRETFEETGIPYEIDRLAFVQENFFKLKRLKFTY